jgi:hypothetical protein
MGCKGSRVQISALRPLKRSSYTARKITKFSVWSSVWSVCLRVMARARSTRAAARGKLKKKFPVSPEVRKHMGMVSDNLSIVSPVAYEVVGRGGGTVRVAELANEIAGRIGICLERFPIPDRGVPASVQAAHSLWSHLAAKIRAGQSVGVHCRAGIGRSGLVVAGTLVHFGIPDHEAWDRAARARGIPCPTLNNRENGSIVRSPPGSSTG